MTRVVTGQYLIKFHGENVDEALIDLRIIENWCVCVCDCLILVA